VDAEKGLQLMGMDIGWFARLQQSQNGFRRQAVQGALHDAEMPI
jgi:hypothetical protein